MITVLLGPDSALPGYCRYLENREPEVILFPPRGTDKDRRLVRANSELRHLLARLRSSLGSEKFEASASRHRVAAAFLLDKVYEDLSPQEYSRYKDLSTDILTHTSHNWYTSSFIIGAWADLFIDMFSSVQVKLILPSIQMMSANLISVIRQILIKGKPSGLHLMVGFGEKGSDYTEDANGIIWDTKVFSNLRESFLCMGESVVHELSGEDLEHNAPDVEFTHLVDSWDSDPETHLERAFEAGSSSELDGKRACKLLRRAFGAYDFRASLQIGLRVLDANASLGNSDRAYVHTATSISAHNRQFPSATGSERLNSFLVKNLSAALELERDVITRSVISYRLATTLARRRKDGPGAMSCIDEALAELRSTLSPSRKRAYYESWLLNIRAYSFMLLRDFEKSAESVETAFGLSEKYWNHEQDLTPGELYSSQLFAGNRATLALYGEDDSALDLWFSRGTEIFEAHSEIGKRYVRFLRIKLLKKRLDLRGALLAGEEGLADAISENSAEYQDLYRMNLAELHFRTGELTSTFRHLEECKRMYQRVREEKRMTAANLLWAAAKVRQGENEEADHIYNRLVDESKVNDTSALADILSARGCIAAKLGRTDDAERFMDEAIQLAVDLGEREVLILVARRSGDALMSTGEIDKAREAYLQGLDMLEMKTPDSADNLPDEAARIYLGLYRCDSEDKTMGSLLSVLREALISDSDLWWELPSLAAEIIKADYSNRDGDSGNLTDLSKALRQRIDTTDLAEQLMARLAARSLAS